MTKRSDLVVILAYVLIGAMVAGGYRYYVLRTSPEKFKDGQLVVQVSGPAGMTFAGTCTVVTASGDSRELSVQGRFAAQGETRTFEAEGLKISCNIQKRSGDGVLWVKVLKDGRTITVAAASRDDAVSLEYAPSPWRRGE